MDVHTRCWIPEKVLLSSQERSLVGMFEIKSVTTARITEIEGAVFERCRCYATSEGTAHAPRQQRAKAADLLLTGIG